MTWQNFDLFDVERIEFGQQFDEVVLPLFEAASERFKERGLEIDSEYREALSNATSEADRIDAQGWAAWKETQRGEQKVIIGSALLNVLCSSLKAGLESMSRYFDTSHPPRGGYEGRSWLHKKQTEFRSRFGIEFEKSPIDFLRIEEVVLARNAGIHDDPMTLEEYREKIPAPRFLEDGIALQVEKDALIKSFKDADKFLDWVWTQLKQIRMASAPKGRK